MGRTKWDLVGAFISSLCVVHCIALPLLVLMAPAIGTFFFAGEGITHVVLFGLVLAAAGMSFIPGYKVHKHAAPLGFSLSGIAFLAGATFLAHDWLGHHWEPLLAICGSAQLIFAHWLNHIKCKSCTDHHCHTHDESA